MVSIWKDWAYAVFLSVLLLTSPVLSYPVNATAVEGPVIWTPYWGKKSLCCRLNACEDELLLTFLPFSKKKGKYSCSYHCSHKGASGDQGYNVSSLLKCTVEVLHESAGQQACRLFFCRRRPASSVVSSPSFHALVAVICVVKGRCMVLQAEPKSVQILAKERVFFSSLFRPNIIFFLNCGYFL